jgi:hypothetical protein
MKLLFRFLLLFVSSLYAHTEIAIYNDSPFTISWQDYGSEYEYMVEIYQIQNGEETLEYYAGWFLENELELSLQEEGSYHWKLYIRELGSTCEESHQCFNIESGYFDFYLPITPPPMQEGKEKKETVDDTSKENIENNQKEIVEDEEDVLGVTNDEYIEKEEFLKEEKKRKERDTKEEEEEVKSERIVDEDYCLYSYNVRRKKFKLRECRIGKPEIQSSTYFKYKGKHIVSSKGGYRGEVKIKINNVVCKDFDVLDSKTWFRCEEVVIGRDDYDIELGHEVYFYKEGVISPTSYIFNKESFKVSKLVDDLPTDLVFKGYFSLNHRGEWLDQELAIKLPVTFTMSESNVLGGTGNGVYNFPFKKIVHVNQWHGCTVYQCPHKGIDFAASKEDIYASDNGVVVSKGYDDYYGECRSGGNYLVVKYDSGHHMAYLHLEKSLVKVNQRVNRGDLIAVSGNSGSYNCQPLGYHLHFELREGRRQSTHIDPVPYIDINWDLVKSNMSNRFPGRLSGDNPHPSF